jgi:hypothetical protein
MQHHIDSQDTWKKSFHIICVLKFNISTLHDKEARLGTGKRVPARRHLPWVTEYSHEVRPQQQDTLHVLTTN